MTIRSQPPQQYASTPRRDELELELASLQERRRLLELEAARNDYAAQERRLLETKARNERLADAFAIDSPYPGEADGVDLDQTANAKRMFESRALHEAYGGYDYLDIIGPGGYASSWGQPLGYGYQAYLNPLSTRVDRAQGRDRPFVITEIDLGFIRGIARIVCEINCPAKGAIRSLVNYTVGGRGFQYTIAVKNQKRKPADGLIEAVQEVVDEFLERVKWCGAIGKEGELVRRWFRDGEYFLQAHCDRVGRTDVRFVEPEQITDMGATAWNRETFAQYGIDIGQADIDTTFGVLTPKHDVNVRWGYNAWYDDLGESELLPADTLQHFKISDTNIKRGISDFYGALKWLQRSDNLLTKTSGGAAVQAAIAGIRQWQQGILQADVAAFRASKTDYSTTFYTPGGGTRTFNNYSYADGTILDIPPTMEWVDPPHGADRGPAFVEVAQAMLRWVATQWSMPEWMISGDASNNNMASSIVAESPFVKNVEGLQFGFGAMWHDLLWRVIYNAAKYGRFDRFGDEGGYFSIRRVLKLHISFPVVETRDRNEETQRLKTLSDDGVISLETRAAEEGFDLAEEQAKGAKQRPAEITAKADGMDSGGGVTSLAGTEDGKGKPGQPKPEQPTGKPDVKEEQQEGAGGEPAEQSGQQPPQSAGIAPTQEAAPAEKPEQAQNGGEKQTDEQQDKLKPGAKVAANLATKSAHEKGARKLHEAASHDVSGESRDEGGKWTSGIGSSRGSKPSADRQHAEHQDAAGRKQAGKPQSDAEKEKDWREHGVKSQAFKEWFGDSKVANEDGSPKIVYHGSSNEINAFDQSHLQKSTGNPTSVWGFFFSPRKEEGERYAEMASGGDGAGHIHAVYLSVKNPYVMSYGEYKQFTDLKSFKPEELERLTQKAREFKQELEAEGYDGIHLKTRSGQQDEFVAFHSNQIKSASGNRGTFSKHSDNINETGAVAVPPSAFADISGDDPNAAGLIAKPKRPDDLLESLADLHESAQHAPHGGATINGKPFRGGEFIPAADMAKATPHERAELKQKEKDAAHEKTLPENRRSIPGYAKAHQDLMASSDVYPQTHGAAPHDPNAAKQRDRVVFSQMLRNGEKLPDSVKTEFPRIWRLYQEKQAAANAPVNAAAKPLEKQPEQPATKPQADTQQAQKPEGASERSETSKQLSFSQEKPTSPPSPDDLKHEESPAAKDTDNPSKSTGSEPAAPPLEADKPREDAAKQDKAREPSEYIYARESAVPNAGEDLKGSARHKVNAWRGLEEAEKDGTAEAYVTRSMLSKVEPNRLMSIVDEKPQHALTALVMQLALNKFPPKPGYGQRQDSSPEAMAKKRADYLDAYRRLKEKAEDLAGRQPDAMGALRTMQSTVNEVIRDLRGPRLEGGKNDYYNETANSLVGMLRACSGRGKTGVIGTANEFGKYALEKYGKIDWKAIPEQFHVGIASHVKDILDGKSVAKAFGKTGEGGQNRPTFNAAELYVDHAVRKGGEPIKAQTATEAVSLFTDQMKMRGVQWGNSVTDEERKHHLLRCAEAFADLADVTGLPASAISHEGSLGIAFGARGKGGSLAHYEPGSKVINLTRKGGIGSLAHEWGHSFDHEVAGGKMTYGGGSYQSESYGSGEPIHAAFSELRKSWDSSGFSMRLQRTISDMIRSGEMSRGKGDYWLSRREMFARCFERYVQRSLETKDRDNTYLVGMRKSGHPLWPTDAEVDAMSPHFEAILREHRKAKYPHLSDEDIAKQNAALHESLARGEVPGWLIESEPDTDLRKAIEEAADATNTEPTLAQAEAGIYKKGRFKWNGLTIVIENPKGSVRRGTDPDGNEWESGMDLHYGYIARSEGADGDHVDVFVGPDPESELVFVVDQVKPDGRFDEHKALIGFTTEDEARDGYLSAYEDGWKGLGAITAMTLPQFKAWLAGDTRRPIAVMETAPAARAQRETLLREAMAHLWGDGRIYP